MTSMLQCNIDLIFAECLQDRKLRYQSNATLQKGKKVRKVPAKLLR